VLDRLLRGHGWVVCVGLLLVGVVFLNVRLLELDGRIARDSQRAAALRHENAELRLRAARLGSSERIQRAAQAHGLVWPLAGDLRFLHARPDRDARLAVGGMNAPVARVGSESGARTGPPPAQGPDAGQGSAASAGSAAPPSAAGTSAANPPDAAGAAPGSAAAARGAPAAAPGAASAGLAGQ
jgi:hypothetical protein